jgi:hypothetical protein
VTVKCGDLGISSKRGRAAVTRMVLVVMRTLIMVIIMEMTFLWPVTVRICHRNSQPGQDSLPPTPGRTPNSKVHVVIVMRTNGRIIYPLRIIMVMGVVIMADYTPITRVRNPTVL